MRQARHLFSFTSTTPSSAALVDRTRWAGGDARRVEAVVADARQVVEDDPLELGHLLADVLRHILQVRVVPGVDLRPAQVVVPVGAGPDLHRLAGHQRDGRGGGLVVAGRRVEQVPVAEGERLVVILEGGQRRVIEQLEQAAELRMEAQAQLAVLVDPAAAVFVLIFPLGRIPRSRPRLDVVPPHILGALAVGPKVLARNRASMAPDALIQMKEHAHVRPYVHGPPSVSPAGRCGGRRRRCRGSRRSDPSS